MKKISWIVGVLIFLVVAGFIALEITKQVIKQVVERKVEESIRSIVARTEPNLTKEDFERRVREEIAKIVEYRTKYIFNKIIRLSPDRMVNVRPVTWAGHRFEIAHLESIQYRSGGPIQWTDNGFIAGTDSMPRAKLLDVNMNQKIKVKVIGNIEGELKSDNSHCTVASCIHSSRYNFVEIPFYFVDADETKYGLRLLGTRDNIIGGNIRNKFKFTWFSVENTGNAIILEDSSGVRLVVDKNSPTHQNLSDLNPNDEWRLRVNADVNGYGYVKLDIKEIQVEK